MSVIGVIPLVAGPLERGSTVYAHSTNRLCILKKIDIVDE